MQKHATCGLLRNTCKLDDSMLFTNRLTPPAYLLLPKSWYRAIVDPNFVMLVTIGRVLATDVLVSSIFGNCSSSEGPI